MGGAKAEQIFDTKNLEGTKHLDGKSLLQISSDGKCDLEELPTLANIGTFGLHTVYGSLKNGIKSSN